MADKTIASHKELLELKLESIPAEYDGEHDDRVRMMVMMDVITSQHERTLNRKYLTLEIPLVQPEALLNQQCCLRLNLHHLCRAMM